jgi:hypothetical protein
VVFNRLAGKVAIFPFFFVYVGAVLREATNTPLFEKIFGVTIVFPCSGSKGNSKRTVNWFQRSSSPTGLSASIYGRF